MVTTHVPGKLILSGEHAVVHGAPALGVAVDRYNTIQLQSYPQPGIQLVLTNLSYTKFHPFEALRELKSRLANNYAQFLQGTREITNLFVEPAELTLFTVIHVLEALAVTIPNGLRLQMTSEIPIGCGMGSSAALIVNLIKGIASYFKINLTEIDFINLAKLPEQLQHGYTSGMDLYLTLRGGCQWYQQGMCESQLIKTPLNFDCVHTGVPASTTGTCVAQVYSLFKDKGLCDAFKEITYQVKQALENQTALIPAIRHNNSLLQRIGTVPNKIQRFIQAVEQRGGAAKLCGAGAVDGDQGGILWLVGQDREALQLLCSQWGWSHFSLTGVKEDAVSIHGTR